jgi:Arc/MetJ-type ribon-helix-helix transcriptional regulator
MPDTEKITINLSAVDLGKVDLLVQEGMYSNRTDFIRTAIRSQLDKHSLEIQQSIARYSYVIGVLTYNRADLEKIKEKGEKLKIAIIGLLILQDNITAELANDVIETIRVRGILIASEAIKSIMTDRIK